MEGSLAFFMIVGVRSQGLFVTAWSFIIAQILFQYAARWDTVTIMNLVAMMMYSKAKGDMTMVGVESKP